jgi:hypothetical protein
MYRDKRLEGFDAASVVEVVEHLDPPRLSAFERVLFEFAKPRTVVLTTPNREFNVKWQTLDPGRFRHPDRKEDGCGMSVNCYGSSSSWNPLPLAYSNVCAGRTSKTLGAGSWNYTHP